MHTFDGAQRLGFRSSAFVAVSAMLLLIAGYFYFNTGSHRSDASMFGSEAAQAGREASGGAMAEKNGLLAKGTDDIARLEAELLVNLRRIAQFDPNLSDRELADYENKLIMGVERDPRIRELLRTHLANAFADKDASSIYFLERVLSVPKVGIEALVEDYSAMVVGEEKDTDFYALQGLANFQSMIPEEERAALLDKALRQLDRYDTLARYGPAMRFAVNAYADPAYGMSGAQKDALRRHMERKQGGASTYDDQFYTAQSLLSIAGDSGRAASARAMLGRYPNRGTIEAVLESIKVGELKMTPDIMSALDRAMNTFTAAENNKS